MHRVRRSEQGLLGTNVGPVWECSSAQAQSSERRKLFSDFQHLCNHLIKLTDYKPGGKHARCSNFYTEGGLGSTLGFPCRCREVASTFSF